MMEWLTEFLEMLSNVPIGHLILVFLVVIPVMIVTTYFGCIIGYYIVIALLGIAALIVSGAVVGVVMFVEYLADCKRWVASRWL